MDFISELEVKTQEHPQAADITSVAAPVQSTSKTSPPCHYCKQTGHLAFNCPARRRDSTKSNTHHRDSPPKRYTEHRSGSYNSHYPRGSDSPSQRKSGFCHIHGACSHDTDKCFTVKKLRDEHKSQHPRDSKTHSSQPIKKA